MLRKRIIFTLLYSDGFFMLSRNFRLQKVGDYEWLNKFYDFSKVSQFIDELVILDVSRGERDYYKFRSTVEKVSKSCFVPVAVGGGVDTVDKARALMNTGADKIVINTHLFDRAFIKDISGVFGNQSIVGSVDIVGSSMDSFEVLTQNGQNKLFMSLDALCSKLNSLPLGEVYINSISNDGTGNGLDLDLGSMIGERLNFPVILAGGIGNKIHITEGLNHMHIDAVATAHLFNFIGDGLRYVREYAVNEGISLAQWPTFDSLRS